MNFENNQGFAIVSADSRTTPVLAIIDEGSLSLDTLSRVDNPGFLIFLEQAMMMQLREIAGNKEVMRTSESVISGLSEKMDTKATVLLNIPARLKTKWGQREPYNMLCPTGTRTGCVITAMAQALSFFKTPGSVSWRHNNSFGSSVLNWNQIIADCENANIGGGYGRLNSATTPASSVLQVAHLMRYLGLAVNAKYGNKGTEADSGDAISVLKTYHGLSSAGLKSYNVNDVRNALANNSNALVYSRANATKKKVLGITVGYGDGHAWIIDGAQRIYYSANDIKDYVHCNWGWYGQCDGFYISDGFYTKQGPVFVGPNDNGGTDEYNFIHENKYAVLSR